MPPHLGIVASANEALAAPDTQERIKQMPAPGDSLVSMVGALGIPLDDRIRRILEGLSPDVVAGIRQATLAALETGGSGLPLSCVVTEDQLNAGQAVDVDVPDLNGTRT